MEKKTQSLGGDLMKEHVQWTKDIARPREKIWKGGSQEVWPQMQKSGKSFGMSTVVSELWIEEK